MASKVISVNVGLPRNVIWKGRPVTTSIFKMPLKGAVRVQRLGLEGDKQADLTVHGGLDKAIYAYPSEHYEFWKNELNGIDLPWGMFGENLTTEGLIEDAVYIGDEFQIGTARLFITQPRLPCYKLGLKFGRDDMIKRFLTSNRSGFYFGVSKEGVVEAGSLIQLINRGAGNSTVAETIQAILSGS